MSLRHTLQSHGTRHLRSSDLYCGCCVGQYSLAFTVPTAMQLLSIDALEPHINVTAQQPLSKTGCKITLRAGWLANPLFLSCSLQYTNHGFSCSCVGRQIPLQGQPWYHSRADQQSSEGVTEKQIARQIPGKSCSGVMPSGRGASGRGCPPNPSCSLCMLFTLLKLRRAVSRSFTLNSLPPGTASRLLLLPVLKPAASALTSVRYTK